MHGGCSPFRVDPDDSNFAFENPVRPSVDRMFRPEAGARSFSESGLDAKGVAPKARFQIPKLNFSDDRPASPVLHLCVIDSRFIEHFPASVLEVADVDRVVDVPVAVELVAAYFQGAFVETFTHQASSLPQPRRSRTLGSGFLESGEPACRSGAGVTNVIFGMSKGTKSSLRKKFDFRWEVLDVIVGGRSAIDSTEGFHLRSPEEADRFIRNYGFSLDNPIEQAEAFGNFHEALNFIRRYFLQPENVDGLKLEVPRKILELTEVRDLFLLASGSASGQLTDAQGIYLRNWAWSILKVMHTIAHMDQDIRTPHFADIQKQIFDRYYRLIQRDVDGKLYLGDRPEDPLRVDLVAFETKPKKARDSTLLKLLHKSENTAEDIFDRVGIRFVAPTRLGCLRVVKYLKDSMIILPPNIKPSRSRNALINLERVKEVRQQAWSEVDQGSLSEQALIDRLEAAAEVPADGAAGGTGSDNRHSSSSYRAVQFTMRQLIKLRNPLYEDLKDLKARTKQVTVPESILKLVEKLDLKHLQREVRFFYPYEVQLVDQKSHEQNEKGRSAHSEYKRAQIQTAMKRVMGPLFDAVR